MRTLFYNGELLSFQQHFRKGQNAMLIENNRIKAIGRFEELQSLADNQTVQIDLEGRTILPGFNDSHIHIWKVGNLLTYMLDLRGCSSLEDMQQKISDYHHRYPELEWIVARGFNEAAWPNNRMPDKNDLDKITNEKPIYIIRTCAHIAIANTMAMRAGNINANTPVPAGGEMLLGADHQPNGIFSETALGLVANHIPPYSKTQLKTMVKAAQQQLLRFGSMPYPCCCQMAGSHLIPCPIYLPVILCR
jgi:predicted amidohydrolase YtcJ